MYIITLLKKLAPLFVSIKDIWKIASSNKPMYEYVIVDIDLCQKSHQLYCILHYRAIGSRRIEYSPLSNIDGTEIITKFPPGQAKIIISLQAIEKAIFLDREKLFEKHKEYIKECMNEIKSPEGN